MNSPVSHASVAEALELLRAVGAGWSSAAVEVALEHAAGRVLAEDVVAPLDLPPFANSAMDGYALRHADALTSARLRVQGVNLAGRAGPARLEPGACVRITTGAPLPEGADTVVVKERCEEDGGMAQIHELAEPGANVRHAGEDYRRGAVALSRGTKLTPPCLGLLASFGLGRVAVNRRPRLRVFSTGDELVPVGQPLPPGRIYDSNGPALTACLRALGADVVGTAHLDDRREAVRDALASVDDADLLLTCGGVSAGEADHLPGVLAEIGEVLLWKVRIKPGMPFLFGRIGSRLYCGLPGNPVSAMVTCLVLVRPLLDAMEGVVDAPRVVRARLAAPVAKRHRRCEYRRGILSVDDDGGLLVAERGAQGSAMQHGLVEANALIELDEARETWGAGEVVRVIPLPWA
ncbi:MAG TPA: molybdopterin molybdotransferase MoeA [Xanthomonadaceae bacterium]|nr:molybdopterin molybdotransferase MoeA [Xanthomonadaceae bacterium]